MKFIDIETSSTLEVKKSKFITHLAPYNQFDSLMARLKQEYPKARHFVYAYRYLNEFEQIVENSSDDGEPKGTSGRPSLAVLQGKELVNTSVIIVRYFGGIKLGTGGLVKSYSDAVNLVLENSNIIEYEKLIKKSLKVDYSSLSKIEYIINKYNINIIKKEFNEDVNLILEASLEKFELLEQEIFQDMRLEDIL
ncbi:MAG: YigZ family protein [Campylobacterota bacterium]|nr:YigZ family protein [Campylobacterota bacterium]